MIRRDIRVICARLVLAEFLAVDQASSKPFILCKREALGVRLNRDGFVMDILYFINAVRLFG
jgi:hypothetical protein